MLKKAINEILNSYDFASLFSGNLFMKYEEAVRIDLEENFQNSHKKLPFQDFCKDYTKKLFNTFKTDNYAVFFISEVWNYQSGEYSINSKSIIKDIDSLRLKEYFPQEYFFIDVPNPENDSEIFIFSFETNEKGVIEILNLYFNCFELEEERDCLPYNLAIINFRNNTLYNFELDEIIDSLKLDFNNFPTTYNSAYSEQLKEFSRDTNSEVNIKKQKNG